MICDSDKHFPKSIVPYTNFGDWRLQQMFAYLRQRECVTQRSVATASGARHVAMKLKLEEIEAHLIYMTNVVLTSEWKGGTQKTENGG